MTHVWSKTRKYLEDALCEPLKGRVTYFLTHYHGAPDQYGRFCVRVDGKEYVQANPYNENKIFAYANKLQKDLNVPRRSWVKGHYEFDEENRAIEEMAEKRAMRENEMDIYQITTAIEEYRNMAIQEAINSPNEVVRMFAILDKRVGKRTLIKLIPEIEKQSEWLRFFYRLRLEAEALL